MFRLLLLWRGKVIVRQEEEYGAEFMIIKFSLPLRCIFLGNRTSHLSDMAVLNQGTKDLHFPLQHARGSSATFSLGMWEAAALQIKWVIKVPSSGIREWFSTEYIHARFLIKRMGYTWFSVTVWVEGTCPFYLSLWSSLNSVMITMSFSALVAPFHHTVIIHTVITHICPHPVFLHHLHKC